MNKILLQQVYKYLTVLIKKTYLQLAEASIAESQLSGIRLSATTHTQVRNPFL